MVAIGLFIIIFLKERINEYRNNKQTLNYNDNAKDLTSLKKNPDFIWLNEVNSQSMQQSLKNLEGAYKNFFKHITKFPKFKSKNNRNSFHIPQFIKLNGNKLSIPRFKQPIECIIDRKFYGSIRNCTISRTTTNEYFVSILVECEHRILPKTGREIGIDLGVKTLAVTSNYEIFKNNRYTKTYAKELKRQQEYLARKTKGSHTYNKQKHKVARIHKKITNSRVDNLHKVSTKLIADYDTIYLEDLAIKNMVKNHKLAKSISDASWGEFVRMLEYKALWNEKEIVKINRFYPSSKLCNICGYKNVNLTLNDREWTCACGTVHDRDYNAALNILKEGIKTKQKQNILTV